MRQKRPYSNEEEFVAVLRKRFSGVSSGVLLGIGDDAAVVRGASAPWVVSVDACIEKVHFDLRFVPPMSVGTRALSAAVSDLAAMGAVPKFFLVSIELPRRTSSNTIMEIYDGFERVASRQGLTLIGGNVSSGARLGIHTTVIGALEDGPALCRSGARAGDRLYVTGELGLADAGFRILRSGRHPTREVGVKAVARFLSPDPRVEQGRFLARHRLAHAAMDLSDGLLMDLSRLCRSSGVGAEVDTKLLMLACRTIVELNRIRSLGPRWVARMGREDYELLCAIDVKRLQTLMPAARRYFHRWFRPIGKIVRGRRILVRCSNSEGRARVLRAVPGWDHFRERS